MVPFEGTLLEFRSQTFPARSWDIVNVSWDIALHVCENRVMIAAACFVTMHSRHRQTTDRQHMMTTAERCIAPIWGRLTTDRERERETTKMLINLQVSFKVTNIAH